MDSTNDMTPGMGDPAYAEHDPLAYMIYHGVNPNADFVDYSPEQARGLVREAQSAVSRMHGIAGATRVSYVDMNRPKHLRTVSATLSTARGFAGSTR